MGFVSFGDGGFLFFEAGFKKVMCLRCKRDVRLWREMCLRCKRFEKEKKAYVNT
jgi:hypothetical protein